MIDVVCATRLREQEFWSQAALGLSLRRLSRDRRLTPWIHCENSNGLPAIYNSHLMGNGSELIVFVHDDVWLEDLFFAERIHGGLRTFDVIGLAGNRRRVPNQPAWSFIDKAMTWDSRDNLSGCVAHGRQPFGAISYYGAAPAECELLDGLLLAMRREAVVIRNVRFDERFAFHFYDMDFCRSARQAGLRLGTWPISVTHQSGGHFGTPNWIAHYNLYIEKWKD